MADENPEVGLITIPQLTNYSPERLHYAIGSILGEEYDITLVGPEKKSDRIEQRFEIETPVRRQLPGPLQTLLMVPLSLLLVLQYVYKSDPDTIAAIGNIYANGLACAVVGNLTGTPSVVRVTSDLFTIYRYQETRPGRLKMYIQNNILGRIAVHLADRVITLGPVMKGKLETKGVPREQIEVIPQPLLFEDDSTNNQTDFREESDISPETQLVLFVGYFSRVKGPERLIRTVKYVRKKNPEIEFLIVGEGGALEQQVRSKFKDDTGITLPGWINHEQLPAYYEAADVLLHPSNSEGLPNVILEAQNYGLPVVATDSGGEVPVHVSNIGRDYRDLGEMILEKDTPVVDQLHPDVQPARNEGLYLDLFQDCCTKL